jgi:hypothetical protein
LVATGAYVGLSLWVGSALGAGEDLRATVADWGAVAALFDTSSIQLGLPNPAVPAMYSILLWILVVLPSALWGTPPIPATVATDDSPTVRTDPEHT